MKKKIVVKISLSDDDSRRDAMSRAVEVSGVSSASIDKEKGQMTVVGEDVDPVSVTRALRNKSALGKLLPCVFPDSKSDVQLVSVEEVKPEDKKKEEEEKKKKEEEEKKKKEEEAKKKEEDKKKEEAAKAAPVLPWSTGYPYPYYAGSAPPGYQNPYYGNAPPGYQWVEVPQSRAWFDW